MTIYRSKSYMETIFREVKIKLTIIVIQVLTEPRLMLQAHSKLVPCSSFFLEGNGRNRNRNSTRTDVTDDKSIINQASDEEPQEKTCLHDFQTREDQY